MYCKYKTFYTSAFLPALIFEQALPAPCHINISYRACLSYNHMHTTTLIRNAATKANTPNGNNKRNMSH